jgi:hypothetical protein
VPHPQALCKDNLLSLLAFCCCKDYLCPCLWFFADWVDIDSSKHQGDTGCKGALSVLSSNCKECLPEPSSTPIASLPTEQHGQKELLPRFKQEWLPSMFTDRVLQDGWEEVTGSNPLALVEPVGEVICILLAQVAKMTLDL